MFMTSAKPWVPPLVEGRLKTFLYTAGTISSYKKGAILVSEEDYLEKIFILKSGVLSNSIMHHELNKSFMMCGIRIPGHISGYTTFILREPAPVRITALSNVEVSSVVFERMDAFLEQNNKLKNEFIRHCGRCLRSEIDAMLAIATLAAEERFWILLASLFTALGTDLEPDWLSLPFKISRDTMSGLLYVSILTIDRIYANLMKHGLMRRTKSGYAFSASAVKERLKWIEARSSSR